MQKIKLMTTMAGPGGTAAAGSVILVDEATAKALIDGKYGFDPDAPPPAATSPIAIAAATEPAKTETPEEKAAREAAEAQAKAAAEAAEAATKTPDAIKAALDQLKGDNDADWTSKGLPAIARVKELTGSTTLTNADVKAAFPDFKRPKAAAGGGTSGPRTSNT